MYSLPSFQVKNDTAIFVNISTEQTSKSTSQELLERDNLNNRLLGSNWQANVTIRQLLIIYLNFYVLTTMQCSVYTIYQHWLWVEIVVLLFHIQNTHRYWQHMPIHTVTSVHQTASVTIDHKLNITSRHHFIRHDTVLNNISILMLHSSMQLYVSPEFRILFCCEFAVLNVQLQQTT